MAYKVPFSFNPSSTPLANPSVGTGNSYFQRCADQNHVRDNYRDMTDAYAQSYGMNISYWTTGYSLANHNPLYGEDPTARYRGPRQMKAIVDLQSYSTFLTKFGVMSDLDIVIYIPIKAFQRVWGNVFPLAGDLFIVDDSACDRPMGQSPMVFEVTEKHDSINPTDFMAGHYVWRINAKRHDNSYEPGAPVENFLGGPTDSKEYGKIESSIDETDIVTGPGNHDVDADAKADFDTPNDSVYGKFF